MTETDLADRECIPCTGDEARLQCEFMGVEPSGTDVEVPNMVFTRIEDGLIAERWVQPDMFGLMGQLGVIELPDE